jgi:4-hydroxyphenylpyruvate dioxygenase
MCDRAAREGRICTIEAMPLWGFSRLDDAWYVVRESDRSNSGIIFDTWHYLRAGRNDALFEEIPVGKIDTVQIADGPLLCPPGRPMARDCLFHRVPIGEGENSQPRNLGAGGTSRSYEVGRPGDILG